MRQSYPGAMRFYITPLLIMDRLITDSDAGVGESAALAALF